MSLFAAIKSRDVGTLRSLISPPNSHHHNLPLGSPPLYGVSSSGIQSNSSNMQSSPPIAIHTSSSHGRKSFSGTGGQSHHLDINGRDSQGNTPLLVAISSGRLDLVKVLLTHPRLNVNAQDLESGYTALHKCLFYGYLQMAVEILRVRPDCDLSIRDKEGNTPLDLMNACMKLHRISNQSEDLVHQHDSSETSSIHSDDDSDALDEEDSDDSNSSSDDIEENENMSEKQRPANNLPPSMSCWMWGSNSNYGLGKSSTSEKGKPEKLDLKSKMPISIDSFDEHDPAIVQVAMSKYHTCILTQSKLYVQGFGPGGRLGLGHEETALRPTEVTGIQESVQYVGVGPDHTMAITSSGNLWTWGSSDHGQLGYPIQDESGRGHPKQLSPRQVTALKKLRCVKSVGSKYHSVILTSSSAIYTWGENRGQLGYSNVQIQVLPRKVTSFPQQKILQIDATNIATAVLTASNEVYVFCNGDITKVTFPIASFQRSLRIKSSVENTDIPPSSSLAMSFRKSNSSVIPIKIVAGNHQLAALMSNGDVYLWSPPDKAFSDTWQQINFPQKRPKRIWSMRKKHLMPVDIAIGIDSTIMIVTESGHVFRGSRRSQAAMNDSVYKSPHSRKSISSSEESSIIYFKYEKLPYLQHIRRVVASSSGGFAAIRSDHRVDQISVAPRRLHSDMHRLLLSHQDQDSDSLIPDTSVSARSASIVSPLREFLTKDFSDVIFVVGSEKKKFKAHQIVLAIRIPFFKWIFCGTNDTGRKLQIPDWMRIENQNDSQLFVITLPETHPKAVSLLLDYIYSGSFKRSWSQTVAFLSRTSNTQNRHKRPSSSGSAGSKSQKKEQEALSSDEEESLQIYIDFTQITKWLRLSEMDLLRLNTESVIMEPAESYFSSFKNNFTELITFKADVAIHLADGEIAYAHQAVLAARCPFFSAMLGPFSPWSLSAETGSKFISVSLKHVRKEIFDVILHFIYTDEDQHALFESVERRNLGEYMEFVVEVLSAANELLLDRLKDLCSTIACRFMEVKHALKTLELADTYHALNLKETCLQFICWNLESFLEGGLLTESCLDPQLLSDIERKLVGLQILKFPRMRGPHGYYSDIKIKAKKLEEEMKNKRRMEYMERKKLASGSGLLSASEGAVSFSMGSSLERTPVFAPSSISASYQDVPPASPMMLPSAIPANDVNTLPVPIPPNTRQDEPLQQGTPPDDNIFEIELEDRISPLPTSQSRTSTTTNSTMSRIEEPPTPTSRRSIPVVTSTAKPPHHVASSSVRNAPTTSCSDQTVSTLPSPKSSGVWTAVGPKQEIQVSQRVSLKSIMNEQGSSQNTHHVLKQSFSSGHMKSPSQAPSASSSSASSNFIPPTAFSLGEALEGSFKNNSQTKMSQKQRRKTSRSSSSTSLQDDAPAVGASRPAPAWGNPASHPSSSTAPLPTTPVKSLREIQQEEEKKLFQRQQLSSTGYRSSLLSPAMMKSPQNSQTSPFGRGGWAGWASPSNSVTSVTSPSANAFPSLSSATTSTQANGNISSISLGSGSGPGRSGRASISSSIHTPTKIRSAVSSTGPSPSMLHGSLSITPPSLLEIQMEQQSQKKHQEKQLKKSFERIQIEERAVQELQALYESGLARGSGEWVTIHVT